MKSSVILALAALLNLTLKAEFLAGVGRVDITPRKPVFLAGLGNNRKSEGVHDPIYATSLFLTDGKTELLLVSLDLIGLFYPNVEEIRQEVAKKYDIKKTDIVIASSHLHSGPDTLGLWGPDMFTSGVDEEYLQFLKRGIVESITKALTSPQPVILEVSQAEEKEVAYNAREEGLIDPTVLALFIKSKNGRTLATVVNYACHPEVLWSDNHLITSDFVHYLRKSIEESEIGGIVLFFNGALGGMVTPRVKEHSFQEARRVGETIARKVKESVKSAQLINKQYIIHKVAKVHLPVENSKFILAAEAGVLKREMKAGGVDSEIHFIDIGGTLQILTNPGEALPKVGFALKALLKAPYKAIIGLACDEIGYILPPEDFNTELYSYESSMSLGKKTAIILLERAKELVSGD